MSRKPKFKPEITRVKLNPEQAVLSCMCYNTGYFVFSNPHFYNRNGSTISGCGGTRSFNSGKFFESYPYGFADFSAVTRTFSSTSS